MKTKYRKAWWFKRVAGKNSIKPYSAGVQIDLKEWGLPFHINCDWSDFEMLLRLQITFLCFSAALAWRHYKKMETIG